MRLILLLSFLIIGFGCNSDDFVNPNIDETNVSLINPVAGQKSHYIRYQTSCGNVFSQMLTGDTLILEVTSIGGEMYFQESYTQGSPLYADGLDFEIHYPVIDKNDYLLIRERTLSSLFYFYGNDTLWTQTPDRIPLKQRNCKINIEERNFIGNEIGYLEEFKFGEIRRTNLTAVSCVPMILDLDGYLMYNDYLHITHAVTENDLVNGWMLIPDQNSETSI